MVFDLGYCVVLDFLLLWISYLVALTIALLVAMVLPVYLTFFPFRYFTGNLVINNYSRV